MSKVLNSILLQRVFSNLVLFTVILSDKASHCLVVKEKDLPPRGHVVESWRRVLDEAITLQKKKVMVAKYLKNITYVIYSCVSVIYISKLKNHKNILENA